MLYVVLQLASYLGASIFFNEGFGESGIFALVKSHCLFALGQSSALFFLSSWSSMDSRGRNFLIAYCTQLYMNHCGQRHDQYTHSLGGLNATPLLKSMRVPYGIMPN